MSSGLTSVKDTDLIILQNVTDDELEELCYSSRYFHQLCQNRILWHDRILKLYPNFPFNEKMELKKLYYKLKVGDWTAIAVWADYHDNVTILKWMMMLKEYKMYLINNIKKYLNILSTVYNRKEKIKVLIQMYNFIYNHRYAFTHYILGENFTNTVKIKLDELQQETPEPELKDMFESYKQSIFNL
ncbi:MAG TPA: hypothetical protein VLG50_04955 [Candidatus Saccharimonadales bacterium]|nr:hypothetical protein [Candidatus Saccharimonadales bacterium]